LNPEIRKILVIRFSSLGDIILTFPFLKEFKRLFPDCKIDFLTKSEYRELILLNPYIDSAVLFDGQSYREIRRYIKFQNYDFIFDLHRNLRSYLITLFNFNNILRYKKNNIKKYFLVMFKINLFDEIIPVYKKYLKTLIFFSDKINFDFTITELKIDKQHLIQSEYSVLSPSSKHFTKTYPKEYFVDIVNRKKERRFILTGSNSKTDEYNCEYIKEHTENTDNFCGKLRYEQLFRIFRDAEYVICNDSGSLHIAEALGKKVFVFYGSTVKEFGFYPQLKTTTIFENKNLKCRPCSRNGKDKCPKNHFKCMKEIKQKIL